MTDLERVKEAASYIRRQEPRADVVNALGIIEDYLDAHLKEDEGIREVLAIAQKNARIFFAGNRRRDLELTRLERELARLREAADNFRGVIETLVNDRDTLLAALREIASMVRFDDADAGMAWDTARTAIVEVTKDA